MKRSIWMLAAWALLLMPAGWAQAVTIPVSISLDGAANTNIGSITATASGSAGGNISMNALFTVTNPSMLYYLQNGGTCVTFQWVQVITKATTTLAYPSTTLVGNNVPIIDTPNGGYYANNSGSGARTPAGEDSLPWYNTLAESSTKGVGMTNFPGDTISDSPTVAQANFTTYLVLQTPTDVANNTFDVVAGFTWDTGTGASANGDLTALTVGAGDLTVLNNALRNAGFTNATTTLGGAALTADPDNWMATSTTENVTSCPEPGSVTLLFIGSVLALGGQRYLRRKHAA